MVAKDARHAAAWANYVEKHWLFKDRAESQWLGLLSQVWLVAILTEGCLLEVGGKLYGIDKAKAAEIDYHHKYDCAIKDLNINVLDIAMDMVDSYEDKDALWVADYQEKVVEPIVKAELLLLSQVRDGVIMDTLDIAAIRQRRQQLNDLKVSLASQLQGRWPPDGR